MINLALFAFSNGYYSTLAAIKAPKQVKGEEAGQVGGFIGITITTGLMLGTAIAFGMSYVIKASPECEKNDC